VYLGRIFCWLFLARGSGDDTNARNGPAKLTLDILYYFIKYLVPVYPDIEMSRV
jgi:hypothetical protein